MARSLANSGRHWDAAEAGQLLVLMAGIVITVTFPVVAHRSDEWPALTVIGTVLAIALLASLVVPWPSLPRRYCLVFPLLVWGAVAALGATAHGVGSNYTALFALCFVYIGLTLPSGSGVVLAPVAVLAYIAAYGSWSVPLLPRLVIVVAVWILVAELLAALRAEVHELTSRLQQVTHADVLTGLANRRDLDLRLTTAAPGDLIIVCDLDNFKELNESRGPAVGDQVLSDFGSLLSDSLRVVDYAARLGGEEFAILLPRTEQALAPVILSRLRHRWSILRPGVTFSSGVATFLPGRRPAETLAVADAALYRAKAAGRNCDHSESGPIGTPPAAGERIPR